MRALVLDSETDVVWKKVNGKNGKFLDPWTEGTALVSVGATTILNGKIIGYEEFVFFHTECDTPDTPARLQEIIDGADLIVCHNAQYDVPWLRACGFKIDKPIYDTMLASYVLARGVRMSHSLKNAGERYGVTLKKDDIIEEYYKKKIPMSQVPLDILLEYMAGDLQSTAELYLQLLKEYEKDNNVGLKNTLVLTNKLCRVLCDVQENGVRVDKGALAAVRKEFETEQIMLATRLQKHTRKIMGDTPINLASPEQLSMMLYSRKPKDKANWGDNFSYWMNDDKYKRTMNALSETVHKTRADKCNECYGSGKIRKTKKNGEPYKDLNICPSCKGAQFHYTVLPELAGLKFTPPNSKWIADAGWSTGKERLYELSKVCQKRGMEEEQQYLLDLIRLNALDSYLATYCGGIERGLREDGIVHTNLLQFTTATARLSSREPNLQNMPREHTFPVRGVFRSRWKDGNLMDADYAQLEFRTVAFLSQDELAMKEIVEGFDVHSYTAKIMTDSGEPTNRQEAKSHTFKPLYGGSTGTPAQTAYYTHFTEKYKGVAAWQEKLCSEAVTTKHVVLPSGREYNFPTATRNHKSKKVTPRTKIVNYPVQGFATADIVPLAMVKLWENMRAEGVRSLLVLQVHDSLIVDVYPGEEQQMARLMHDSMTGVVETMKEIWNVEFNVPLAVDIKYGPNWLKTKEVKLGT